MTFSLVGRCAHTGMLGGAVTTSSIAVGSRCLFARAGIGAALTQHRTDPRLGPLALDLIARGFTAEETKNAIVAGKRVDLGGCPSADERERRVNIAIRKHEIVAL